MTSDGSLAELKVALAQATRERDEALEQQTATSEVLQVISASPGELAPVFEAMLENATRICQASFGTLYLYENDAFRAAALHNVPPAFAEARHRQPVVRPSPDNPMARVAATKLALQSADVPGSTAWPRHEPQFAQFAELTGARSLICVPMLKDDVLVGVITVYRTEPRPFTDKQIALLTNFAAQAVIAIENTRLLSEQREALERQTATSQVLQVISSSPGALDPVFEVMLENATKLCEASYGTMYLAEGDGFHAVARHGTLPAAANEKWWTGSHFKPRADVPLGRCAHARAAVHVADMREEPSYIERDPWMVTGVEALGLRSLVVVPMLKEGEVVGAIAIYRTEVRPFTDKQIELVTNFAAQAVIAVENTRLLNELRARTEELRVLNEQLEGRVKEQVTEIERMSRLRRFLPPQVADLIVSSGAESQLESHRREITALFCDLRGFTGFSESADPEDVMALLREYHAVIGNIIHKHGGTLERFVGDGVMVIFNDPIPLPNPALQAVQMAVEMRASIGALMEKWRRLGHELGFGIGIAHGYATLGTIGFEGRFDYAAIGTVSNVAARLCDEAKPGQILISPRVQVAVEGAVTVEPVGEFELKGIRRPMLVQNVTGEVRAKS